MYFCFGTKLSFIAQIMENKPPIDKQIVLLKQSYPAVTPYLAETQHHVTGPSDRLGMIFLGVVLNILGNYLAYYDTDPMSSFLRMTLSVLTIGMGLGVFILVLVSEKSYARHLKIKNKEPEKPWLWDLPWGARKIRNDYSEQGKKIFYISLVVLVLMLSVLLYVLIAIGWIECLMYSVFVLGFILFARVRYDKEIIQYLKFGCSHLSLQQFPFWVGEKFTGTLHRLPEGLQELSIILRFIVAVPVPDDPRRSRCYQVYMDSRTFNKSYISSGGTLTLEWDIPEGSEYHTQIRDDSSMYWEMELFGEMPFVDYRGRFLLPVYSKTPPTKDQNSHFLDLIQASPKVSEEIFLLGPQ